MGINVEPIDKLKIFISYSHADEEYTRDFIKHIAPLRTNGLIQNWYDRMITAGETLQTRIDSNLEEADIICLMVSANFLSSAACMEEVTDATQLKTRKLLTIIPVILSPCGWQDIKELSNLLALPIDGKPISSFENSNQAWNVVYEALKRVVGIENRLRQIKSTDVAITFLQDAGLLSKAHSRKEKVNLDDIFVYPEMTKYDESGEQEKIDSAENLARDYHVYPKLLIAGEDQSGRTSLCKMLYADLRRKGLIPIYINHKANHYHGKMSKMISDAFDEQYRVVTMDEIDKNRIVPIVDDFHFAKHKDKHINELAKYSHHIVVVDDIFSLSIRDESIIKSFAHFKIRELVPSLRNELIVKWMYLSDKHEGAAYDKNLDYQVLDKTTELVNTTLGKLLSNGIMPAYPFFILSVISLHETFQSPLEERITSQGHCYQALIYLLLRRQSVSNNDIDTYINFLAELAFYFYEAGTTELSKEDFSLFMESYLAKYNLPLKQEVLIRKLCEARLVEVTSLGNYCFYYPYIYYYFVAKRLSDNVQANAETIDKIINNLHKDENAYIAIFISHHSKDDHILDEILLNAYCIFDAYKPATLGKGELAFFDDEEKGIVEAALPGSGVTPEVERQKRLREQDALERARGDKRTDVAVDVDKENKLTKELRRGVRTVEVMGRIIKNRAGSLEKSKLENIFREAMNIHLRILTSFFEFIKNEEAQQDIVDIISERLNHFVNRRAQERRKQGKVEREPNTEELKKISSTIFWNINFFVVYAFIGKIIHSLGSSKLSEIIEKVCDEDKTPASFLVKHGILMWYNKALQVDTFVGELERLDCSHIAKKIMRFMVVNHCSMHWVSYRDKQRIEQKLSIPAYRLVKKR